MADAVLRIDAEQPWPWLSAYTAEASAFFNGRDEDIERLLRCVLAAPATVFFGKSGLGKTSLVQAGLAPALTARQLLPVLCRLKHPGDEPAAGQLLTALDSAVAEAGLAWSADAAQPIDRTAPEAADALWLRLHDSASQLRDTAGRRWTAVFILDQFEEVFTLGREAGTTDASFASLGDLIEGRIPPGVAKWLDQHDDWLDRINADRLGARFVLSLREDYLADLEVWADRIPRLGPNRCRLLPMSHAQALKAVATTGGSLVSAEGAERIVGFLGRQQQPAGDLASQGPGSTPAAALAAAIEPALLSLVCAGLNRDRLEANPSPAQLDTGQLDQRGGKLLESFYDDAFAALPSSRHKVLRAFVQHELITADGTRRPFPLRSVGQAGVTLSEIDELERQRLLRRENSEHGALVELVHDRLAQVAAARYAADRLEAQRQAQEAERRQRVRRQSSIVAMVVSALSVALAVFARLWVDASHTREELRHEQDRLQSAEAVLKGKLVELAQTLNRATSAEQAASMAAATAEQRASEALAAEAQAKAAAARARHAEALAKAETQRANTVATEATALRLLSDGAEMVALGREGGQVRGLLTVLAGHALARTAAPYVSAASYGALQRQHIAMGPQRWLRELPADAGAVAFSPDGSRIVTAGADGTLQLWEASSGAEIGAPLRGHSGPVRALAFSPDGSRIVSGSADSTLRLWDARTGSPVGEPLKGHSRSVLSVGFSPDGSRIVSGGADKTLRLWQAGSGTPVGEPIVGHGGAVVSVAFSPDGSRLVSGGGDRAVRLWNARSGQPIAEPIKGHADTVVSVAFSLDGSRILSSDFHELRVWDAGSGLPVGEPIRGHGGWIRAVAFSPDGSRVTLVGTDDALRVLEARSGLQVGAPLKGHSGYVRRIAWSQDGARVASIGADRTLRLWEGLADAPAGKLLGGHSLTVQSVAFSPDGSRIVSGGVDDTLRLWDARSASAVGEPFKGHRMGVESVAFSPDGSRIVSGGGDYLVRLWDARDGSPVGEALKGHTDQVNSVAFSPDGSRVVSGSADLMVRLWDARSGSPIGQPLEGHSEAVRSVAFSPDGSRIATGGSDNTVRLWDARSGAPIGDAVKGHKHRVTGVAFSPDGLRLVSGSGDGTLQLWDSRNGAPVGEPLKGALCPFVWNATTSSDRRGGTERVSGQVL